MTQIGFFTKKCGSATTPWSCSGIAGKGSKALEGSCVPAEELFQEILNPSRDASIRSVINLAKRLRCGTSAHVVLLAGLLIDHSVFTLFKLPIAFD